MEREKAKKMKGHENTQLLDRLSDLPDALIHHILSFLDTKYALQTCLLSKRWLTLTTHLSAFNFFCHYSTSTSGLDAFKKFIALVMDHRKSSPVTSFRLRTDAFRLGGILEQPLLDKIVNFAVSDSLQELDLSFALSQRCCELILPLKIFTCQSLKSLKLRNFCTFGLLPNFQCVDTFPSCINLQKLVLDRVGISASNVFNISAPQLVNLTMLNLRFYGRRKVVISAPKLTSFHLSIREPFVLSVDNSPLLDKLNVSLWWSYLEDQANLWILIDILRELGNARSLVVSPLTVTCLSNYSQVLKDQPSPFKNLESFEVQGWSSKICPQVMNFLICNSPLAEKMAT